MTNTEALQSLIHDVSASLAGMQQDLSSNFKHPDRERAQLLHEEVREFYAEGAYMEAFQACETLVELLENVEIEYMYRLEKNDVFSIQESMHHDLELVKTAPEDIVDERVEEMETYKQRIHKLTISHDSLMYRIVYHNLLWLELVLVLVLITITSLLLASVWESTPPMWYLLALVAVISVGVWVLRMTRHSRGVIGIIVVGLLTVVGYMFFVK